MPATKLDPKTALIVIDMQVGISKYPTLRPFPELIANSVRLADAFRRAQLPVVLVNVDFHADGGDRLQTRVEQPRNFQVPPEFAKIVPELGPQPSDILVTKHQWSAFYGTDLDLQLRRRQITGVVFTGVAASIGVDSSARAAHERGYNVSFASDAISDVDAAAYEFVTQKIFPRIGELDTTDALLALLSR